MSDQLKLAVLVVKNVKYMCDDFSFSNAAESMTNSDHVV